MNGPTLIDRFALSRRRALAWSCAPLAGPICALLPEPARAAPTDRLTVLYRRDTVSGPTRLDPAVQSATLALEGAFAERGFTVVQPTAEVYRMLDQGPAVVVNFAPDAGFSMLLSAQKNIRPMPGMDKIVTEVTLRCTVFVGHSVAMTADSKGSMAADASADVREFAARSSAELAGKKAAEALVGRVASKLRSLAPADIQRMSDITVAAGPTFQSVPLPPAPPPAPAAEATLPGTTAAPPPPAPAPMPPAAPSADAATPETPPARKFALVITVSDYKAMNNRLGYPADLPGVALDRRHLIDGLKARGYKPENLRELSDARATSDAVREQLGKLAAETRPDDQVLIVVSSHGAPGDMVPSGFGLPILADFDPKQQGKFDFWQLQSLVANLPARRTVLMVDTCFSGGATQMMTTAVVSAGGVSVQQGTVTPDPARMAQAQAGGGRAFAVLAAASPKQTSLEDGGGGLFTTAFLKALDAGKGERTLEQLFRDDVYRQVVDKSRTLCKSMRDCVEQTPMFAYAGRGNQIKL